MQAAMSGEVWQRKGNRHPASAPCNSFLCQDGYVMLAVAHDKQWASLCRIIGRDEFASDPRTATVAARKANEDLVEQLVAEWVNQRTRHEVVTALNAASIAVSPVLDFGDIIREPHFREREIVCEVEHATVGTLTHYGVAPKFAKTPARVRSAAPDIVFSFYYRHLLGPRLLALPPFGAFNIHGSLLPQYRGRAPVNWAILNGERETGATLHEMTARPDAGRIVDRERVPILPNDVAREVFDKVTVAAEIVTSRMAGTCRLIRRVDRSRRTENPTPISASSV